MRTVAFGIVAGLLCSLGAPTLFAHHSLASYDTTKAVRVKGRIVQFHQLNPHTIIYIEETDAGGQIHRWAVEGPAGLQLKRTGFKDGELKSGDIVEVCGYLPKELIMWQVQSENSSDSSPAGRLINAETLVMPNGKMRSWGDYGVHKCFDAGYKDQHSK